MYAAFASVYDRLMADVDYQAWAAFYHALMERYGLARGKVCECACGTGSLTIPLAKLGYQMTGVDLSADMLFEAAQKARKEGIGIPFVKQDMRQLNLHRQMDAVLCTNDGINYLKNSEELVQFFTRAWETLKEGGVLMMDLSTPYKLENVLGDHFIGDETEDIAYLWQNRYHPQQKYVELNLAIFVRQQDESYTRIGEYQKQYVHESAEIFDLLKTVGFERIGLFGDKRMEAPREKENRWFITARKPYLPKEQG